jgi:hypothetical protein
VVEEELDLVDCPFSAFFEVRKIVLAGLGVVGVPSNDRLRGSKLGSGRTHGKDGLAAVRFEYSQLEPHVFVAVDNSFLKHKPVLPRKGQQRIVANAVPNTGNNVKIQNFAVAPKRSTAHGNVLSLLESCLSNASDNAYYRSTIGRGFPNELPLIVKARIALCSCNLNVQNARFRHLDPLQFVLAREEKRSKQRPFVHLQLESDSRWLYCGSRS